jgi:7-cyano-7-deazaguanine synthase
MKAVVLFSGGIDSTVCLTGAVKTFGADEVVALTMFYGQKHEKELESAKAVAEHLGVKHMIKDLSAVFEIDNNPLLSKSTQQMPQGSYAEQERDPDGMSKTYVPFRNGLFLSYAAAIAYSLGATRVFYGAHADDAAGNAYPDCTEDFYDGMNAAIFEGTGKKVQMYAPLLEMNKAMIVREGIDLNAPLHLTWSCYEGRKHACGKCGTCIDRLAAFEANNAIDTIPYEG